MSPKAGIGPVLVLGGAIVLTVVLYMAPYNPLAKADERAAPAATVAEYDLYSDLSEARNGLDSATLAAIGALEATEIGTEGAALDSVAHLYDELRKPAAAAYIARQKAEKYPTAKNYAEAGSRYLLCARFIGDQAQKKAWFAEARKDLEKALSIDPKDLGTKVNLGVCLVEGAALMGEAPMAGIGLLKEVEQLDPNNVDALLNLGYFSIRSGQYDKAEERFMKVTQIKPEIAETHLYLADLHERTEKFEAAIADLETYLKLINDPRKEPEVRAYIEKLRTNIKKD